MEYPDLLKKHTCMSALGSNPAPVISKLDNGAAVVLFKEVILKESIGVVVIGAEVVVARGRVVVVGFMAVLVAGTVVTGTVVVVSTLFPHEANSPSNPAANTKSSITKARNVLDRFIITSLVPDLS
jgi:hypothetical protein